MPRRLIDLRARATPLLDVVSYARRGAGRRDHLSPAEVEQIARTVRHAPEVMVKVLSRGAQDFGAVRRHIDYLRLRDDEELEIETDDGQRLSGEGAAKELLKDWDLDLEEHRRRSDLEAGSGRSAKLVHKLMFSMPARTPPDKMLAAVKSFAREEFGLKHRYAMVLHTDEPHPHVHMVVKAVSETGVRLHIRKATLREWRREFARYLRAEGVAANATERAVRGQTVARKTDGIYRASQRQESSHWQERVEAVGRELLSGDIRVEPGKNRLMRTRKEVELGLLAVSGILANEGHPELVTQINRFVSRMSPPRTEKEGIAEQLRKQIRDSQVRNIPLGRYAAR